MDPKRVLGDVFESRLAFWFNNGTVAKNIYELVSAISACNRNVFQYHDNSEKNDFYNWILDVLGDDVLAKKIRSEKDQKKMAEKIRKRIKELEKK